MRRWVAGAVLMLCQVGWAQMAPTTYHVGAVRVTEEAEQIVVHADPPIKIESFNAGHTWPLLSLDEDGHIYVGSTVISPADGRVLSHTEGRSTSLLALPYGVHVGVEPGGYRIVQGHSSCLFSARKLGINGSKTALEALKDGNVIFAPSNRGIVAMVTQWGSDERVGKYLTTFIQMDRCRTSQTNLGNPDLLVELNASRRGGWWITGSIEQTLLRSVEGVRWRRMKLPKGLGSLVSSYVVDDKEIWLAAYLAEDMDDTLGVVYSGDGGRHWRALRKGDPQLRRLPKGWLEGHTRVKSPE